MIKISDSAEETISLGRRFSHILKKKDVVVLAGALGGGKTTFTKGILRGFGYRGEVLSPSFTLVRQYRLKGIHFYHIDLYRIDNKDLFSFGIEDYLYNNRGISLVEWGEKIEKALTSYIRVDFFFLKESRRKLIFSYRGNRRRLTSL